VAVAAAAALLTTSGLFAWRPPEAAAHQPPGRYVVASAEDARIAQRPVAPGTAADIQPAIPGSLPLLFVGSLLLGLAAAVRRTT